MFVGTPLVSIQFVFYRLERITRMNLILAKVRSQTTHGTHHFIDGTHAGEYLGEALLLQSSTVGGVVPGRNVHCPCANNFTLVVI